MIAYSIRILLVAIVRVFRFFSHVKPQGGRTLMVEGAHTAPMQFVKSLTPKERNLKLRPFRKCFEPSKPSLAELSGHRPRPSGRTDYFMNEPTEVDGVPLRVTKMTGEPGDVILCHPFFWHMTSSNGLDYPRFMRTKDVKMKD